MRLPAQFAAVLAAVALVAQPAAAQSILRDAETEALLDEMAAPLIDAAGLEPGNVDIVMVNDRSINAFVAGGQAIYIHTGPTAPSITCLPTTQLGVPPKPSWRASA